jgi:antirestriction protein ArdC
MSDQEIKSVLEKIESISRQQLEENREYHRVVEHELGRSAGASDVTNKAMFF